MMGEKRGWLATVAGWAAVTLALGVCPGGCHEESGVAEESCPPELVVTLTELQKAATDLEHVAALMKAELAVACAGLASDLGATNVPVVGDGTDVSDEDLSKACELWATAIDAELGAGASINLLVGCRICEIQAQAQLDCEGACSLGRGCDGSSVMDRCAGTALVGHCSGACAAGATCVGSAESPASCSGSCSGECVGECDGVPVNAAGCNGRCDGTCAGCCKLAADADVSCGADVSCRGGCSVVMSDLTCTVPLLPPSCDIPLDCASACEGQGRFEATCTTPQVYALVQGNASPALEGTLEAHMPGLFDACQTRVELVGGGVSSVGAALDDTMRAMLAVSACSDQYSSALSACVSTMASASAEINLVWSACSSAPAGLGAHR
jgi:hypothetical protein